MSYDFHRLLRTNVTKMMIVQTTNSGPIRLCSGLASCASHENSVWPRIGISTALPKPRIRPVIASTTNAVAVVQCTNCSQGWKRRISRPVRGECRRSGPFHA